MARTIRGCPTAWYQAEDAEELEIDPQQGGHPDDTEGKVIVDFNQDISYGGQSPRMS